MKHISNWAHRRPFVSQIVSLLLIAALLFVSMLLGGFVAKYGSLQTIKLLLGGASALFATAILLNNQRHSKTQPHSSKTAGWCIIGKRLASLTAFMLLVIVYFGSNSHLRYSLATPTYGIAVTSKQKAQKPDYNLYTDKDAFYRDLKAYYRTLSLRELRRELKHQMKAARSGQASDENNAGLIVVIIILALLLLFGCAALGWSAAWAGQEFLALFSLFLGLGVIIGAIALIVKISNRNKKQGQTETDPQ